MQCNHKALGKGRACSGRRITSPAVPLVLYSAGSQPWAWLEEDTKAEGAWHGAEMLCYARESCCAWGLGHGKDHRQRWAATLPWMHLDATSTDPYPLLSSQVQQWRMVSPPQQYKPAELVTATLEVPIWKQAQSLTPRCIKLHASHSRDKGEGGFSRPSGVISEPENSLLALVIKL